MLEQVLSDTPDILTKRSIYDYTILHLACLVDDVELVKHLLSIGALVEMANAEGDTPLHVAVKSGAWSSAELLVNKGCQVNVKNNLGRTPLLLALGKAADAPNEVIRFSKSLLSRGADVRVETNDKLWWHEIFRHSGSHREDLSELYEILFAAGGAHVIDLFDYGELTPLIDAVLAKDVPLISFLEKVGARCDVVSNSGWNLLHWVSDYGDSQCCQLAEGLEISCIDIRTTDNDGFTPLKSFRWVVNRYRYCGASDFHERSKWGLSWRNVHQDNPGEELVSPEKSIAFEHLLRSIRDRMLVQEIEELEVVISKIHALDLSSARGMLKAVAAAKVKAKIYHEAETFRAIDLDVREGRLELAVESIEEFIGASRDRMLVSPFDEEVDPYNWSPSNSEGLDGESTAEIETDDEDGADQGSLEENDNLESLEAGDSEDDGWKTAEED
ncbi:hypothetical protein E0Z10_g10917 [Xylaria hypoxylon]|uniref:Uncharacterized protein n=1 Tax=Xylaria hypoxylon TaxID=37992 RepID=A0A4Z0YGW0_9PEZI|nr:hypothetical protein E0Z10_g10917 [Xylaria hypoxylon]